MLPELRHTEFQHHLGRHRVWVPLYRLLSSIDAPQSDDAAHGVNRRYGMTPPMSMISVAYRSVSGPHAVSQPCRYNSYFL
jgi:hypothetical protein